MLSNLLKLLLLAALLGQQQVPLVDLTNVPVHPRLREPISASGSGSLVGYATATPQSHPLSLQIVKLAWVPSSKSAALLCEIQLENISKHSIDVPVDPSSRDVEPASAATPYQYLNAVIWFENAGLADRSALARKLSLYGARNAAGSLKTLQPGEAIRIRANVPTGFFPGEPQNGPPAGQFKAHFALYHDYVHPVRQEDLGVEIQSLMSGIESGNTMAVGP
jgi:hypothetical protein